MTAKREYLRLVQCNAGHLLVVPPEIDYGGDDSERSACPWCGVDTFDDVYGLTGVYLDRSATASEVLSDITAKVKLEE
jgi:hypothetical protein